MQHLMLEKQKQSYVVHLRLLVQRLRAYYFLMKLIRFWVQILSLVVVMAWEKKVVEEDQQKLGCYRLF